MIHPLVSVVIPVYNGLDFITQAIDSVLAQSHGETELIVVDDGSDDVVSLMALLSPYGTRVRLLHQPHSGIAAALNRGVSEMRGTLFSWLSHDDLYHPQKLATEVAKYLSCGGDVVVCSDYCYIDNTGNVLEFRNIPRYNRPAMRALLLQDSWLHGCALLIPKSAIEAVGGFNENLETTQDYDLFFRLAERIPFVQVNETLVAVRLHRSQTTHRLSDVALFEQDVLYSYYVKSVSTSEILELSPTSLAAYYCNLFKRFRLGLLHKTAEAALAKARACAGVPLDWIKLGFAVTLVNPVTVPILRPRLIAVSEKRRDAFRSANRLNWKDCVQKRLHDTDKAAW